MKRTARTLFAVFSLGAVSLAGLAGAVPAVSAEGDMVAARRLTESQYRHTVADLFGADIAVNGRFEPERREEGLLAIGAAKLSISGAGFDQYYSMARGISDQVFDPKRRAKVPACTIADPKKVEETCVAAFVKDYGYRLFRRPLTEAELAPRVAAAKKGGDAAGDHYVGMELALTSLLVAPEYLFRIERAEPDPKRRGARRLDGYTKATRLSHLIWDTTPDAELLRAAQAGELHDKAGLARQVDRMLASDKTQAGVRAFFSDMLQFEFFDTVTKDVTLYPKFSAALMEGAREQTLKTLVDQLITKNGDYRDIFTSRETFINRQLASAYQVPFVSSEDWVAYTVPAEREAAGVITQVTFLSLFSHPGRSSPTKRGVALNEVFLCEQTPLPPADVDVSIVNDTANPLLKTVRDRLLAHATDESCAGCHNLSDPLGLALERFDSLGQFRELENGQPINVSASLDGKTFSGATGLGQLMHDNPRAQRCLVRNIFAYGVGRATTDADDAYLDQQTKAFARDGYRLPGLLRQVAVSDAFFALPVAKASRPATRTASLSAGVQP